MNLRIRNGLLLLSAAISIFSSAPALAATDPDMIPPDVTYSTASPPAPVAPAAKGATPTSNGPAAPGITLPDGSTAPPPATVNGYSVPKTGRVSANMQKAPGTAFNMDGSAPAAPGSSGAPPGQQTNTLYKGSGVPVDPNAPDPIVVMTTSKGVITMRLFRQYAPISVDNFVDLVMKGFYNGLTFHRVEPGFVIQGGCPSGTGTGIYIDPETHAPRLLPLETSGNLKHTAAGVVAMARMQSPNSGSCQFYITLTPQPSLDGQYAVFGGVISGLDVVKNIEKGDKIVSANLQQ